MSTGVRPTASSPEGLSARVRLWGRTLPSTLGERVYHAEIPHESDAQAARAERAVAHTTKRLARPADAARLSLVVDELLANAIRFGVLTTPLRLEIFVSGDAFRVQVANRAVASRCRLLERDVERVLSSSPDDAYRDAVERVRRASGLARTGVGLARLRAEAGVDLAFVVADDEVTVVAFSDALASDADAR